MPFNYLQASIPVICLLINVLVQVFIFRCASSWGLLKSVFLGFIIGLLGVFVNEFYIFFAYPASLKDFIAIFITDLITYSMLGYCYFHFINLGETGRRIRILRELYDSKEGLSMEEILQRYNAKEILEKRINRLINNGQLVSKNGRYYIRSSVMLLIARVVILTKLIVLGKRQDIALAAKCTKTH